MVGIISFGVVVALVTATYLIVGRHKAKPVAGIALQGVLIAGLLAGCAGTAEIAAAPTPTEPVAQVQPATPEPKPTATPVPTVAPTLTPTPTMAGPKHLVVIDAGHQAHANLELEPVGPGATTSKYKVAGGTSGVATGTPEYERTLQISLLLQQDLLARGYDIIMVRTTNDVNISNSERADIANEAEADAFLRIHCNGSEDGSANGAMTLCQTKDNPYNGNIYEESASLANSVLDALVASTGCHREYVWETDTMAGINWSRVPTTLIEVGYMTNPEEDTKMADADYQEKIASGIADGVDEYFAAQDDSANGGNIEK